MSNNPQMPILITQPLVEVLSKHKINPEDYRPAYDGESIGLDLYNAGPDTVIPPLSNLTWGGFDELGDFKQLSPRVSKGPYTPKERTKVLIETGLHTKIPPGWGAILKERGSITKSPLILRAGVIDPGYTKQVFVNLVNCSCDPITIKHGDKLPVQLVVLRALTDFVSVSEEEFNKQHSDSQRQGGMIGSSDNT